MMITEFSFEDAVHDHLTVGFVDGCIACAQTKTDSALSRESMLVNQPVTRFAPVLSHAA